MFSFRLRQSTLRSGFAGNGTCPELRLAFGFYTKFIRSHLFLYKKRFAAELPVYKVCAIAT